MPHPNPLAAVVRSFIVLGLLLGITPAGWAQAPLTDVAGVARAWSQVLDSAPLVRHWGAGGRGDGEGRRRPVLGRGRRSESRRGFRRCRATRLVPAIHCGQSMVGHRPRRWWTDRVIRLA